MVEFHGTDLILNILSYLPQERILELQKVSVKWYHKVIPELMEPMSHHKGTLSKMLLMKPDIPVTALKKWEQLGPLSLEQFDKLKPRFAPLIFKDVIFKGPF